MDDALSEHENAFAANQKLWDARTPYHVRSDFYDVDSFRQGECTLRHIEVDELGDEASEKSLLHLQCHFGLDTLSWARRGAKVTGLDFSASAIEEARRLAGELSLSAEFAVGNVYDAADLLHAQYDIVFTSYGVLLWLPSLKEWAQTVARCLAPGGVFYIVEHHPMIWTLDDDLKKITYPYFNDENFVEEASGSYADRDAPIDGQEHFWNHSLAETLNSLIEAGLVIEYLHEFPYLTWNCLNDLVPDGPGRFVHRELGRKVPYLFSLRAHRPRATT